MRPSPQLKNQVVNIVLDFHARLHSIEDRCDQNYEMNITLKQNVRSIKHRHSPTEHIKARVQDFTKQYDVMITRDKCLCTCPRASLVKKTCPHIQRVAIAAATYFQGVRNEVQ